LHQSLQKIALPWFSAVAAAVLLATIVIWPLSHASIEGLEGLPAKMGKQDIEKAGDDNLPVKSSKSRELTSGHLTAQRFAQHLPGFDHVPPRISSGLALCLLLGLLLFVGRQFIDSRGSYRYAALSAILVLFSQPNLIVQSSLVASHLPAMTCLFALNILTLRMLSLPNETYSSSTVLQVSMPVGIGILSYVNTIYCGVIIGVFIPIIAPILSCSRSTVTSIKISFVKRCVLLGLCAFAGIILVFAWGYTHTDKLLIHGNSLAEHMFLGLNITKQSSSYVLNAIERIGYINLPLFGLAPLAIIDALKTRTRHPSNKILQDKLLRTFAISFLMSITAGLLLRAIFSVHMTVFSLPCLIVLEGCWLSHQLIQRDRLTIAPVIITILSIITLQDVVSSSELPLFAHLKQGIHLEHRLIDFRDYWRLLLFIIGPLLIIITLGKRVDDCIIKLIGALKALRHGLNKKKSENQATTRLIANSKYTSGADHQLHRKNTIIVTICLVLLATTALTQTTLMSFGALRKIDRASSNYPFLSAFRQCFDTKADNRPIILSPLGIKTTLLRPYLHTRRNSRVSPSASITDSQRIESANIVRNTRGQISIGTSIDIDDVEAIIGDSSKHPHNQQFILVPIYILATVHQRLNSAGIRYDIMAPDNNSLSAQFNDLRWIILAPASTIPAKCRRPNPLEGAINPKNWNERLSPSQAIGTSDDLKHTNIIKFPIILPNELPNTPLAAQRPNNDHVENQHSDEPQIENTDKVTSSSKIQKSIRIVGAICPKEARRKSYATISLLIETDITPSHDWDILLQAESDSHRTGANHRPVRGAYLSRNWQPGDHIVDEYPVRIPGERDVQDYHIYAGLTRHHAIRRDAKIETSDTKGRQLICTIRSLSD